MGGSCGQRGDVSPYPMTSHVPAGGTGTGHTHPLTRHGSRLCVRWAPTGCAPGRSGRTLRSQLGLAETSSPGTHADFQACGRQQCFCHPWLQLQSAGPPLLASSHLDPSEPQPPPRPLLPAPPRRRSRAVSAPPAGSPQPPARPTVTSHLAASWSHLYQPSVLQPCRAQSSAPALRYSLPPCWAPLDFLPAPVSSADAAPRPS